MAELTKKGTSKGRFGITRATTALNLNGKSASKSESPPSHKLFPKIFGKKQLAMAPSSNLKINTSASLNDIQHNKNASSSALSPHHNTNPFMKSSTMAHKTGSEEKQMTYNPYGSITKAPTFSSPAQNSSPNSRTNTQSTSNSLGFYLGEGKGKVLTLPVLNPNDRLPPAYQSMNVSLFDDFELMNSGKSIGQGGSSEVKLLKNKTMKKQIYILKKFKILKKETDEEFYIRILREFMLSKRAMGNINVINTYHLLKIPTTSNITRGWGFVMEFCPQGDLFSLITASRWQGTKIEEKLCLFKQICSGVRHLHHLGIAHRDLKPENVLLFENGVAKVIDFGISVTSEEGAVSDIKETIERDVKLFGDETKPLQKDSNNSLSDVVSLTEEETSSAHESTAAAENDRKTEGNVPLLTRETQITDQNDKDSSSVGIPAAANGKQDVDVSAVKQDNDPSHPPGSIVCCTFAGSPPYVPAEVFRFNDRQCLLNPLSAKERARGYDAKMFDSWSLGILLYTMLSMKNPFQEPTKQDLMFREYTNVYYQWLQYVEKEGKNPYPLGPSVETKFFQHLRSRDLSRVLCRLLAIDLKKRYTLEELFEDPYMKSITSCVDLEIQPENVCKALCHKKEPLMIPLDLQEAQKANNKEHEISIDDGISSSPLDADGYVIIPGILDKIQTYKAEQREDEALLKHIYNPKMHNHCV